MYDKNRYSRGLLDMLYPLVCQKTTEVGTCKIFNLARIQIGHKRKVYNAHKVVWWYHNHDQKIYCEAVLSYGNRKCVNIEHLYYSPHEPSSKAAVLERLLNGTTVDGECLIARYSPLSNGYGLIDITGTSYLLHRVVYWIFSDIEKLEEVPNDHESGIVRHQCRNKLCVNHKHYQIGSHADNMKDKIRD